MIIIIPTSQVESNYSETVTLDGETHTFKFLWNTRSARWYLTLLDPAGEPIFEGCKLVADIPIKSHLATDNIPIGQLWTRNPTGTGVDPALRNLGTEVLLMYADENSNE